MTPPERFGLRCPTTRQPLRECDLAEAERIVAGGQPLETRRPGAIPPVGPTPRVMVRADDSCAYPILESIPILLRTEALHPPGRAPEIDLADPRFAEAYEEMDFYDAAARHLAAEVEETAGRGPIDAIRGASGSDKASFPSPRELWLDAPYDAAAQSEAYGALAPLAGKRLLQIGGKGHHAVKFLLGGAAEAWAVSPMLGEMLYGAALARRFGVADRFRCAVSVAEELPFSEEAFDGVYAGGCVHHLVTEIAFAEFARVLRPAGTFGAAEPWRAPFYGIGTRILGKRERDVHCRPLTADRTRPFFSAFPEGRIVHHGALTRYPLLALSKLGLSLPANVLWTINRVDDALCAVVPPLRRLGSSVSLIARR